MKCLVVTSQCSALLAVLVAACNTDPGSARDAADASVDGAVAVERAMRDGAVSDFFPTQPLCAGEKAYPPIGGEGICTLPSVEPRAVDVDRVNLALRIGGARVLIFDRVSDSVACGDLQAWHYDDAVDPVKIMLCPEACSLASSDPDTQVQILGGCEGRCAQTDPDCKSAAR